MVLLDARALGGCLSRHWLLAESLEHITHAYVAVYCSIIESSFEILEVNIKQKAQTMLSLAWCVANYVS